MPLRSISLENFKTKNGMNTPRLRHPSSQRGINTDDMGLFSPPYREVDQGVVQTPSSLASVIPAKAGIYVSSYPFLCHAAQRHLVGLINEISHYSSK